MSKAQEITKQVWTCIIPTGIKASTAHSSQITQDDKLAVGKGARLTATLAAEDNDYWIISEGVLNDQAIPERLRYVYKKHWRMEKSAFEIQNFKPIDTILFYGQSNAGAGGEDLAVLTTPIHRNLLSFASRRQLYGNVPMEEDALTGITPVSDHPKYPSMQATPMGFALANKYGDQNRTLRDFFIFTVWYGAQPLSAFAPGTALWDNLLSTVRVSRTELARLNYENKIKALVFVQGEAGPGGRKKYGEKLSTLLDEILPAVAAEAGQSEPPIAILLQINKGARDKGQSISVELAQWDVVQHRKNTILAGPAYQAPLAVNIHQTAIGRLILGELFALVYDMVVYRRINFKPLHPLHAKRDGRIINVEFQLPPEGQALAWDTSWVPHSENFGFTYVDEARSASIEKVEISGPSSVRITLTNYPTGIWHKLHYAQRQGLVDGWASGRGQLISCSGIKSYFYEIGYKVPPYINHYCIRFVIDVQ